MNDELALELEARINELTNDLALLLESVVADAIADALGGSRRRKIVSLSADVVMKEIARKPAQRIEELSRSLQAEARALRAPLQELLENRRVKKAGKARGTRYSPAGTSASSNTASAKKPPSPKKATAKKPITTNATAKSAPVKKASKKAAPKTDAKKVLAMPPTATDAGARSSPSSPPSSPSPAPAAEPAA